MLENGKVDTRVTVETPEGVDFQFLIAGPGKRGSAFCIDTILKVAVIVVFMMVASGLNSDRANGVTMGFSLLVWFGMSWLYGSCCEAFLNGQTLGKKSQKLRVVRTNGTPIGWFEAFGRNLLLVADCFFFIPIFMTVQIPLCTVGIASMAATGRMQRLGDLVFDTMVIDESREFISRAPGITQGVEAIPRAECSGRYYVPERTLAVIERLFEGDRLISDGRREEIARNLSLTLREWLGFEEPAPDPRNPNTYFTQVPTKHTVFLKRVLKTFAEDEVGGGEPTESMQREADRLRLRRSAVGGGAVSAREAASAISDAEVAVALEDTFMEDGADGDAGLEVELDRKRGGLPADWRTTT